MGGYKKHSVLIFLFVIFFSVQTVYATGGRIPAKGKNGMVVSTSMTASEVGRDILKQGGNAIDAAVATAFALSVVWPSAGNIGGGGFIIYHGDDGTVTAFDFREKAPLAANKDMYLGEDGKIHDNINHEGLLAVGVPGTVAGLYLAHQRLGKLPWAEVVKPAVKLAKDGFPYTWGLYSQTRNKRRWEKYPTSVKKMFRNGEEVYLPGETWKQPDLAETLLRIQKQGRDGFYKGKTAKLLAEFMKENGGIITEEDLLKYQAFERKPIHGTYRDHDVYAMCPPSSGGTALVEMLNILEGYNLKEIGHNSALYLHLLTEAMRRGFADRAQFMGDPDFNQNLPIDKLISKSYAGKLRSNIDMFIASESDSALFNQRYESTETTHFSVVDGEGNAVSLTFTLEQGFGTRIVVEGLGFFLNNEMGDFNAIPGLTDSRGRIGTQPNLIAPQKRMLSSMTPTIVAIDGKPVLVVGSPGGRTIINTVLQVILNYIDHDMDVAQAVEAGRIHHQWLPNMTTMENWAISPDTQKLYGNMGHKFRVRGGQGRAMGISIDLKTGIISGAADSRSPDGGAAVY